MRRAPLGEGRLPRVADRTQPTSIALVVLGRAGRPFVIQHDDGRELVLHPTHGDLLFMTGRTQQVSTHGVPQVLDCMVPRYSISLRRDYEISR